MVWLSLFATTAPSSITDIIVALVAIVGLVGIIGGASSYFYKGRADALIELQEKEIKVLNDNIAALKDQNEKMKEERAELISEIKRMRAEIKTLRSLITQPKQLNALAKVMAEQHNAVIDKLTDIAGGLVSTVQEVKRNEK